VTAVPLGPDTELRVEVVADSDDRPMLDVRLFRRAPDDSSGLYPTHAGLRVPAHLAALVAEAIKVAGRRAK
jgi:hypothetical protein